MQNTHEIAQRYQPEATVVYVDNDPAVNAYGRALLEDNENTHFATADLTKPEEVLAAPETDRLDWTRPLVLMQCLTLHHISDDTDPWSLMRRYIDALPHGSYVALSHLCTPDHEPGRSIAHAIEQAWRTSTMGTGWFRAPHDIHRMLDGLALLQPGLVPLEAWWPSGPRELTPSDGVPIGAVGYKP